MEAIFIAILSVCMSSTSCQKVDEQHYVKYISEPFAVSEEVLMSNGGFMAICEEHLEVLRLRLSPEEQKRPKNALCTRKDIYDKKHH